MLLCCYYAALTVSWVPLATCILDDVYYEHENSDVFIASVVTDIYPTGSHKYRIIREVYVPMHRVR